MPPSVRFGEQQDDRAHTGCCQAPTHQVAPSPDDPWDPAEVDPIDQQKSEWLQEDGGGGVEKTSLFKAAQIMADADSHLERQQAELRPAAPQVSSVEMLTTSQDVAAAQVTLTTDLRQSFCRSVVMRCSCSSRLVRSSSVAALLP